MPKVIPRYRYMIDWEDTGLIIDYDKESEVVPKSIDYNYGSRLSDIHDFIGLSGSFDVDDPDGIYNPLTYPAGSPERIRLETPHRFYEYRLDDNPPNLTDWQTGFCIPDRRPDKYTSRFRVLDVNFVRLREMLEIPVFNTYDIPPPPPFIDIPDTRPTGPAVILTLIGFSDSLTQVNIQARLAAGLPTDADITLTVTPGTSYTLPAANSVVVFSVPVQPGSSYNAVGTSLTDGAGGSSATLTFTVPLADDNPEPEPDPEPDPEPEVQPNIQVASFSAVPDTTRNVTFSGTVDDLNDADGDLTTVQVTIQYKRVGEQNWSTLSRETPTSGGAFSTSLRFSDPGQTGVTDNYEARAYVNTSTIQTALFSIGSQAPPPVTGGGVLTNLTARALSDTSGRVFATVSLPTGGASFWFRYRKASESSWTNGGRRLIDAATGAGNGDFSGLDAGTAYIVEGATQSNIATASDRRSTSFTTTSPITPCSISAVETSSITTTSATITVTVINSPSFPAVSLNVAGRTLTSNSLSFGSGVYRASFNVLNLTQGTSYTATASAPNCGSRATTFTTVARTFVTRWPEVTEISTFGVVRTGFSASAIVNFGSDDEGMPFSASRILVSWQYRQFGSTTWLSGGTGSPNAQGRVTASFTGLDPLTSYQVRARVVQVDGRTQLRVWSNTTVRTGKVTQAAINQWIDTLNQAVTAQQQSQDILVELFRINALLSNMHREAQNVIDRDRLPTSKVSRLRRIGDDNDTIQDIGAGLDARIAELQASINNLNISTIRALAVVGIATFTAGAVLSLIGAGLTIGGISGLVASGAMVTTTATGGLLLSGGGTIFLITGSAVLTIASVVSIALVGIGVLLGNSALNDRARDIRDEIAPQIAQSNTTAINFRDSPVGPDALQNTVDVLRAIVNNLEREIVRD